MTGTGLRGGLGPPLPVHTARADADRQRLPGAGAQPGRPDPVHQLAADGVRGGDGQADLAPRRGRTRSPSTSTPRGPCSHSGTTTAARRAPRGRGRPARRSTRCVDTGTYVATSGSPPTARSWGLSPTTASSSSGTQPPAGHWNGGTPSIRGASASARTMTWSTAAAPTRCSAPGTCPRRTPTCSRRPRSTTPRRSRTPTSPRTGGRWPIAGSTTQDTGWVRFVDTATGEATPPTDLPAQDPLRWSLGTWHPDGGQYVGWCVRAVRGARHRHCPRHRHRQAPPATRTLSTATASTAAGVRRRGSPPARGRRDDGRTLVVDAETLQPRGEPFDFAADNCASPRSGTGAPRWSTSLPGRRSPSTGG